MARSPCCDKNGIKKGPWTQEEDLKLRQYIQIHGPGNWRTLPKKAGLQRCGKSCRLRWTNYLRPDIKRGRFSSEEEGTIIQLHGVLGNKWSAIATHLPGRTDNEIKNYWNTHIRKRLIRNGIDPVTHTTCLDLSSILNSTQFNLLNLLNFQTLVNQDVIKLATLLATSSSNQENQELFNNNHINPINQNPNQQIQNCTSTPSSFPSIQLLDQAHIMPVNDQKNNGQSSEEKLIPPCFTDNSVKASENSSFQRLNIENKISSIQNLDFDPVSSSPTHVHSSSTFINSNITEDKRGSRCSDMFQLEIPESLEFDYFM